MPSVLRKKNKDVSSIKTSWATSVEIGSCNACHRHFTMEGYRRHDVLEIQCRSIAVRVCRPCLDDLTERLNSAKVAYEVKKPLEC